ncbi:MAG: tryptophan 7-halogenase [Myxococcales bacterium]|nr:tryptophan 7-halogenase [Myxococcales bacterium]MBL0194329.1 tryptophan 7-halogenase [Myxococcales bacterium]HQY62343.1 NAD(P)/FAD-dependent oxidoreductase [Polyangiaceae bacterium]
MLPYPTEVDVVIIGAGPAGSLAAARLARQGHSVLMLEQATFPRHVVGESLLPRCLDLLRDAGLLERVEARGYEVKRGATFFRRGEVQRFAFERSLPGDYAFAYQVPRDDFDQTLATGALALGADVRFGVSVTGVELGGDRGRSRLSLHDALTGRELEVRARFVLDASGPGRVLAKALSLDAPADLPTRTARYLHVEGDLRPEGEAAGDIWVTIHPSGAWLWVIPFSNGRTSVGVVAEESLFATSGDTDSAKVWSLIATEPVAARRLAQARPAMPTRVLRGWSRRTTRLAGRGFAIAGNAGDFLDPVFSSGVMFAMESGSLAAALAARELAGERVDWPGEYEAPLQRAVGVFRTFVGAWYAGELAELFFHDPKPDSAVRNITSVLGGNVQNTHNPLVRGDTRAELDRLLARVRGGGAKQGGA